MTNKDVDNYIAQFDRTTKQRLVQLRVLAHKNIPDAHEKISYGVPTICDENGTYIAYFAGYKNFVSIYPVHLAEKVNGIEKHLSGKSTARFNNSEPLPEEIVTKLFTNLYLAYQSRHEK